MEDRPEPFAVTFETLMMDGSWELARVPNVMFEAFMEDRDAPFAVTFETLMMAGSRKLSRVPNVMFEAFMEDRDAPLAVTFETTTEAGRSALTRDRNKGADGPPTDGPANTWFVGAPDAVPVPPEEIARGVPRVRVSIDAPCATVKA